MYFFNIRRAKIIQNKIQIPSGAVIFCIKKTKHWLMSDSSSTSWYKGLTNRVERTALFQSLYNVNFRLHILKNKEYQIVHIFRQKIQFYFFDYNYF